MEKQFKCSNLMQTEKLAKLVAKKFLFKKIVLFYGEMGSGKTTFILKLLNALKIKNLAGSPTFTIVNEYNLNNKKLLHFDLYRIENENELVNIDFKEQLESADLVFIEWPDIAKKYIDINECLKITINKVDDTTREFILKD